MFDTKVTVGTDTRVCNALDALRIAEEMGASPENPPRFAKLAADATELRSDGGSLSVEGKARSETDRAAAESAGYVTAGTVVARGQAVNSAGVANATAAREAWEHMPLTSDGCLKLIDTVNAENRQDLMAVSTSELRMTDSGMLTLNGAQERLAPTTRAFRGLVSRLGCGGADYLLNACTPKLRAINVNHQATGLGEIERKEQEVWSQLPPSNARGEVQAPPTASQTVLRTRGTTETRECYAVVSPSYAPFDADKVADVVRAGILPECRGVVSYDGQRSRFEALLHTTVQPENFVAGEFFRAGIVCDSDDTGAGGIRIRGVVYQNLCLNLIILDEAWQSFGSVVHKGSARRMVRAVQDALRAAVASLEHFREVWGYACVTPAVTQEQINMGREISALACFRGILQRELVKVPGKVEDTAHELLTLWNGDESSATQETDLSKAAVVNAFTALAHTRDGLDAWQADEISAQAGRLLLRKQPLPFELIEA